MAPSLQLPRSDPWIDLFSFAYANKLNEDKHSIRCCLHIVNSFIASVSGQSWLALSQIISGHSWRDKTGLGLSLTGSTEGVTLFEGEKK